MELFEDLPLPCSNDLLIVKGKRTKRPNPSSSNGSGSSGVGDFCNSTTTSTEISTSSEEDEDMANCLILLSSGGFPKTEHKFQETDGKVVHECKTCNRTFPSFQALGGHRASHKRPKIVIDDTYRKKSRLETPTCHLDKEKISVCVQNRSVLAENSKSKTHECSICGSEFGSGQALGGHMRRHRSVPTVITNNSMKSGTHIENDMVRHDVIEKSQNVFDLDLNLPAPSDDDRMENFRGFSPNQQGRLVFSAAVPLVDCHY